MILQEVLAGDLAPKKLTGIAIKKTQGSMMATQFLPERSWPEFSGYYKTYNDYSFAQQAPEVGEGSPDSLLNTAYEETSFTMSEYRIGGEITERAINFLLAKDSTQAVSAGRALVSDEVEFLTDTLTLREETKIISALKDNVQSGFTVTANGDWSNSGATPINNLRRAIRTIRINWHTEPDTLLINPVTEENLLNHAQVTGIYTNSGNTALLADNTLATGQSRSVPRLTGLDVFVHDGVTTAATAAGLAKGATETLIVGSTATTGSNWALVFKRGNTTGVTYVAEPLTIRRWEKPEYRSVHIQMFKTFVPVIFRPKQIALIENI